MPGPISDSYEGPAGPEWDAARKAMEEFVVSSETPPCRACGSSEKVLCFPDNHALAICPECCDKAEHPDGETGHKWEHNQWERGRVCVHCGIPRRYTDYDQWEYEGDL